MSRVCFVALVALVSAAPLQNARADDCGNVSRSGECFLDTSGRHGVRWCEDERLTTAICPVGEICARHDDVASGLICISLDATKCSADDNDGEAIPVEGKCTSAGNVVWCREGDVEFKECKRDEVCTFVADKAWYDCVPKGATSTSDAYSGPDASEADAGYTEVEPPDDTDDLSPFNGGGPTPHLQEGRDWKPGPGEGCQGGMPAGSLAWLAALLLLLVVRRRG